VGTAEGTLVQNHIGEQYKLPQLESARMFMPGWLVRAFELAISGDADLHAEATESGLLRPRFDGGELVFLSLLLGELQRQILYGDSKASSITVSADAAKGHLSRFDSNHREKMLRVFESLGQLRFLAGGKDSNFDALRLFSSENWSLETGGPGPVALTLTQEEYAGEILTGFIDAHMDLLRLLRFGVELRKLTCQLKPLVIWTPVWLELTIPEQLVYLRMESVMQTHGSWLRLDGLTGAPVDYLMRGMRGGKRTTTQKAEDQQPGLLDHLRLFGRLGRRLVAHGVIRKQPENGYMATDSHIASRSPSLLWQASAERLRSKADSEYSELVANRLLARSSDIQIDGLLTLFSGISSVSYISLKRIWDLIRGLRGVSLNLAPGVILQSHFLFIEWVARSSQNARIPLPEILTESKLVQLTRNVSPENTLERFRSFCDILSEKDPELDFLDQNQPSLPVTVAVGAGMGAQWLSQLAEWARATQKNGKNTDDFSGFSTKTTMPTAAPGVTTVGQSPTSGLDQTPANPVLNTQRLQKLACQELEKMIYRSPTDYVALKRKYISSLDSETRSMVLNVERRLDSRDFDKQLRTRLVRFMVENPASWTSKNSTIPI